MKSICFLSDSAVVPSLRGNRHRRQQTITSKKSKSVFIFHVFFFQRHAKMCKLSISIVVLTITFAFTFYFVAFFFAVCSMVDDGKHRKRFDVILTRALSAHSQKISVANPSNDNKTELSFILPQRCETYSATRFVSHRNGHEKCIGMWCHSSFNNSAMIWKCWRRKESFLLFPSFVYIHMCRSDAKKQPQQEKWKVIVINEEKIDPFFVRGTTFHWKLGLVFVASKETKASLFVFVLIFHRTNGQKPRQKTKRIYVGARTVFILRSFFHCAQVERVQLSRNKSRVGWIEVLPSTLLLFGLQHIRKLTRMASKSPRHLSAKADN